MLPTEQIDHIEYPKRLVSLSSWSLHYIMRDCRDAIKAYPDGHKAGYYADEINYCVMELNRRRAMTPPQWLRPGT
jgi:hypothetical protein